MFQKEVADRIISTMKIHQIMEDYLFFANWRLNIKKFLI